ncbi:hypothetical protein LTR36_001215 [Oleoguttula mirabilis]|uniref:Beta-lactamase-related domain-containing protein n=1 Tax=Oleoguttula mirabilis TaxID=1507867 RepID=A0AAV9JNN0_9PEZI|nr:hypothetical protein LTR36_001215 [Oleoguttula mirabilis]
MNDHGNACIAVVVALSLAGGACTSTPQLQQPLQPEEAPYFDKAFEEFVLDTIGAWHMPGLSIAVVDGENVYSKGYGYAVLPDIEATADTQYFTGSTTKAFTAAAVAQLVHDAENYPDLHWTSPINQHIRNDFVLADDYITAHTTLEDALSHRSGLPRHDFILGQQNDTLSDIVQRMRYLPMTAAPRTTWQYCNLMFAAMTDFLQAVTGMQLEKLLRQRFWGPLGMDSTSFALPASEKDGSRLARGYYWDESAEGASAEGRYVAEPYVDLLPISGAGATISTVNDYALWIKSLLHAADHEKPANKSSPVSHGLFRDLINPRTIVGDYSGSNDDYAFAAPAVYSLGWISARVLGEVVITHGGGVPGFGTDLFLVPGKAFGFVLMGNTAGTSNVAESVVASRLLTSKILGSNVAMGEVGGIRGRVEKQLRGLSQLTLPAHSRQDSIAKHKATDEVTAGTDKATDDVKAGSLPLPGSIQDYSGLYTHRAYGVLNFTVVPNSQHPARPSIEALTIRMWPEKIRLVHITDTVFELRTYVGHGMGDYTAEVDDAVVWEYQPDDVKAIFKFGLDGEVVETLGMELEERMIEVAREKGERYWKEGMVWFERVLQV